MFQLYIYTYIPVSYPNDRYCQGIFDSWAPLVGRQLFPWVCLECQRAWTPVYSRYSVAMWDRRLWLWSLDIQPPYAKQEVPTTQPSSNTFHLSQSLQLQFQILHLFCRAQPFWMVTDDDHVTTQKNTTFLFFGGGGGHEKHSNNLYLYLQGPLSSPIFVCEVTTTKNTSNICHLCVWNWFAFIN